METYSSSYLDYRSYAGAGSEATPDPAVSQPRISPRSEDTRLQRTQSYSQHDDMYEPPKRPRLSRSSSSYQRPAPVPSSKPRKYHKRSGSKSVLSASSVTSTSSSKPKRRRKPKEQKSDNSHAPSSSSHYDRSSSRNTLSDLSRTKSSSSSTLSKRLKEDQNDRIRRHARTDSNVQDRARLMASPSLLSVFSALTGTTSSSSGSNVTITPARPRSSRHSLPREASKRHDRHSRQEQIHVAPKEVSHTKKEQPVQRFDVFDFLEQDVPDQNSPIEDEDHHDLFPQPTNNADPSPPQILEPPTQSVLEAKSEPKFQFDNGYDAPTSDSFYSDSGISVGGDSPDTRRLSASYYLPPTVVPVTEGSESALANTEKSWKNDSLHSSPLLAAYNGQELYGPLPINARPKNLLPYYSQPTSYTPYHSLPISPQPQTRRESAYSAYSSYSTAPSVSSEASVAGYELLASKLSAFPGKDPDEKDKLVPVYRRFEPLHHRVLLHLQDEIAELEEQLRVVEEYISRRQQDMNDPTLSQRPSSRREDAHYGDSLKYQRTDLLGRICMKLSTYSQTLESYRAMVRKTESASQDDISKYKDWLHEAQPIAKNEASFLDHSSDLISISSRARLLRQQRVSPLMMRSDGASAKPEAGESQLQPKTIVLPQQDNPTWLPIGCPAAMLLTFLSFAIMKQFWMRIVLLWGFGAAGCACLHESTLEVDFNSRKTWCYIGIYISIMTAVAGIYG